MLKEADLLGIHRIYLFVYMVHHTIAQSLSST